MKYSSKYHPDPTYWAALNMEKFEIRAEKGCEVCLHRNPHITVFGRPLCKIDEEPNARGYCRKWRYEDSQ